MATRGVIARKTAWGFTGRYHHWDSYQSGLGLTLFKLHRESFHGETPAMMRYLIDDHPAGWSTLVGRDCRKEAGFIEDEGALSNEERHRPQCYCHGDRQEPELTVREHTDVDAEYAYVIDEQTHLMDVLVPTSRHPLLWSVRATVNLNGPVPNWQREFN